MPRDTPQGTLPKNIPTAHDAPDFLVGGGELGALMREHDWSNTVLGPPAAWPQPLRTAVRLMLNTGHPMYIFWGETGACLYNDAYRQSIGPERHPGSLGRPAREVWDEIWDIIGPQIAQVMSGDGATWHENHLVPITRHGQREDVYWTYSYGPIDDKTASSGVGGVLVVCTETTESVHAQQRQAFLIRLDEELRDLSDPRQVIAVAAQLLGQRLQAGRCGYGEVDETGTYFAVECDWTDGIMPSLAGQLRLDDFGPQIIEEFRAGRTVRLNDHFSDTRTESSGAAYQAAGGMRAEISAPLIKDGRFVAALYVHQTAPRRWSDNEAALVSAVAERTWAALGRARAEAALRESERGLRASETQFRTFAQAMANHVWTAPPSGLLDWFNDRVYEYSGAAQGDLNGQQWTTIVHRDDLPAAGDRWAIALSSGETYETEFRLRRADGVYRWHIARAVPIRTSTGEVARWIGTNTDIEDQKNAAQALADINVTLESRVAERTRALMAVEDALRQSQKMEAIGQLTGGIAHDFNNLLTGIIASLAMIRRRIQAGRIDELDRFMETATASAHRAAALTHRLLAFARRQSLDPKSSDVNALVEGLVDILRRTIGERVELEIVTSADLWPALADANQLENAILNLAINARDAMPDGGRLIIQTENVHLGAAPNGGGDPGDYIMVSVSDNGSGMPADVVAKAFDPFFTTKPLGQGTGLGLSMVYGFAKQSGGHARIESEVGKGTVVKLYVPRALQARDAKCDIEESHAPAGHGETILVVEDDETVRLLATSALSDLGYRYLEAADAHAAMPHILSSQTIDLLLTDVGLPHLNGRQLAEIARQHRPALKVLFMTGYAEKAAHRGHFLELGMDLISKPLDLDALGSKIREMIEG